MIMTIRVDYDAELQRHNEILRRSYGIRRDDHVLDVGCGAGQTTRDAARLAAAGRATGIDVSAAMIDRARRLTDAQGLHNVAFEQADAEVHDFAPNRFDVVISRFGTMFFANPMAAFTNIGRAMQSEGRLVMLVWQTQQRNDWSMSIQRSIADVAAIPPPRAAPDAFSLADPTAVAQILDAAGFGEPAFTSVDEPVYYGPDIAAALAWVCGFANVNAVLQRLEPAAREPARAQLRQMLAAHARDDGVWFDSAAWLVTAVRRGATDSR
jgi:SAM-dependent methyltransferase